MDGRLKLARKHQGIFEKDRLSKWESQTHDGMITISLTFVIFSMKYAFPTLKGPKKLKAIGGREHDDDDDEGDATVDRGKTRGRREDGD
eukprot:9281663-Pyramimonas_sp.AAC.1